MKTIYLDLTECKYLEELHEKIRVAFDFPDWYGKNWSAFWDLLWSECDADELIIMGEKTLPEDFEEDIETMHKILERNVKFRSDNIKYGLNAFSYKIIS